MKFYSDNDFIEYISKVNDDVLVLEYKCLHYILDTDDVKDSIFIDAYTEMDMYITEQIIERFLKKVRNKEDRISNFRTV